MGSMRSKEGSETKERGSGERFGKDVGEVVMTGNVMYGDLGGSGVMTDDMMFDLNVLSTCMEGLVA